MSIISYITEIEVNVAGKGKNIIKAKLICMVLDLPAMYSNSQIIVSA